MLHFKKESYKKKLIALYVGLTLFGVFLVLVSIYNASREQLVLDYLHSLYSVFNDRVLTAPATASLEELATNISSEQYRVIPYNRLQAISPEFEACEHSLSNEELRLQRINAYGGVVGKGECQFLWVELLVKGYSDSLLVIHRTSLNETDNILSAYSNRLVIPIAFFIWLVVWGGVILGNLINRLQLQKDEVEHLAMHDSLTGLANREKFSEKISNVISYSSRKKLSFMLAMVDLNKFKNVNDELGHQYGDILLQQVAERFTKSLREYDVVARFGGDEFVLLLMGEDMDVNEKVLQRIYKTIIEDYNLPGHTVTIGASIGVSYYPQHDTSYSELVHKADVAMYLAKEAGGGIHVFQRSMMTGVEA